MRVSLPGFSGSSEQVAVGGVPKGSNEKSIVAAVRRVTEAATDFTWPKDPLTCPSITAWRPVTLGKISGPVCVLPSIQGGWVC